MNLDTWARLEQKLKDVEDDLGKDIQIEDPESHVYMYCASATQLIGSVSLCFNYISQAELLPQLKERISALTHEDACNPQAIENLKQLAEKAASKSILTTCLKFINSNLPENYEICKGWVDEYTEAQKALTESVDKFSNTCAENLENMKTNAMDQLSTVGKFAELLGGTLQLSLACTSAVSVHQLYAATQKLLNKIEADFPRKKAELDAIKKRIAIADADYCALTNQNISQLLPVLVGDLIVITSELIAVINWINEQITNLEDARHKHRISGFTSLCQAVGTGVSVISSATNIGRLLGWSATAVHAGCALYNGKAHWDCGSMLIEVRAFDKLARASQTTLLLLVRTIKENSKKIMQIAQ